MLFILSSDVWISTRRDNYNASRSSLFRIAYRRYLLAFFAFTSPWNETAMPCTLPARPFLSSSSIRPLPLFSLVHVTLLPLSELLLSSLLLNWSWMRSRRSNPSSSPSFSFPAVFLPLPRPKCLNPTSHPPTSSFSSATLPSLPHLLFSYQPGRTRIHILQTFMMAAAHLCEPACWDTSSLPRAGSPPSNQSDTGSAQANPALSLLLSSTTIPHHLDAL